MHFLVRIIVGIVAGTLAKQATPRGGPGGASGDLILGVLGTLAGGWLFQFLLGSGFGGWFMSAFAAFIGAVAVLYLSRAAFAKRVA
jgi:uncharacterized membrane protein YeaQ/YmgE (transglycosylase-associated protein family)